MDQEPNQNHKIIPGGRPEPGQQQLLKDGDGNGVDHVENADPTDDITS